MWHSSSNESVNDTLWQDINSSSFLTQSICSRKCSIEKEPDYYWLWHGRKWKYLVFIFQCIGMKNSDPWHTEADYKITRANTWTGKMKDLGPAAKLNMVLKGYSNKLGMSFPGFFTILDSFLFRNFLQSRKKSKCKAFLLIRPTDVSRSWCLRLSHHILRVGYI